MVGPSKAEDESRRARKYENTKGEGVRAVETCGWLMRRDRGGLDAGTVEGRKTNHEGHESTRIRKGAGISAKQGVVSCGAAGSGEETCGRGNGGDPPGTRDPRRTTEL